MALKDIFKMIKADRYTADGCEEIKKAQEAIAEDAGLPDGSMSHRKDGDYIKQAGKWVPAKRANGGAKKADKSNPNGVVAQQKQKMETEKHEAARRDAQAPSKKTEVNTPGLRKDVQEAIKRSSPEEIKAYIKELRTPGSRMSRYFDNPDLLANVYEDELKKATESKPEKGSKEDVKQRLGAYVKVMNKKNGEFAGKYKESKAKSDAMKQGQLAELNRASAESKPEEKRKFDQRKYGTSPAAKEDAIRASIVERMTPEQREAVMNGRTLRTVKEGQGVIDITKEDLEFFDKHNAERKPTESKPTAEPKLKEGVMNSRKAKAFKPELEEIRKSDPQRFRENLIDVLSSWTDENEGYLKNSSLTNLMNLYKYERNQMYETGDAAPRQLTGDCKVRIKKS